MAKAFSTERLIRFSHCDPAGIVFFVNFFEMISGIVEDWFRDAVGLPFQEMHLQRRGGSRSSIRAASSSGPVTWGTRWYSN